MSIEEYLDYPCGRSERIEYVLSVLEREEVKLLYPIAKGYRGVVFKGYWKNKPVAVKVERCDSGKKDALLKECNILKYLSSFSERFGKENPAPFPYLCLKGIIVMELIEGVGFERALREFDWREVTCSFLEACAFLDFAGVNHSEIKGKKHLIFSGRGRIIDFESASFSRHPRNVLQFVGYYLVGKKLLRPFGVEDGYLFSFINFYKKDPERAIEDFKNFLFSL